MKLFRFIFTFATVTLLAPCFGHSSSSDCPDLTEEVDYLIIGGGTAGCPLSAKLSNRDRKTGKFKNRVLVLEAGVNLTQDPAVLAANILATTQLAFDPKYSATTTPILVDTTPVPYTDGRGWGGSTLHNGLQAYRGTPSRWNEWAAISGDSRWSYNRLLRRVMKRMEHYTPNGTPVDHAQRGTHGPLFITQEPPVDTDSFMIATSIGTNSPLVDDLNDPNLGDVGIGANQDWVTPPYLGTTSIRSFAANSYWTGIASQGIPPIIDENGFGLYGRRLRVLSNVTASHIEFDENKTARAVKYYLNDSREAVRTVRVKKKVIICTGTIRDAALLQRSGIGDRALLESLNIPVVYHNPNVGANMQNHYGPQALIGGPLCTIPLPQIGSGFIDLSPFMSAGTRRYQLFMTGNSFFFPSAITNALKITQGNYVAGSDLDPQSKGKVAIVSQSPFVDPRIDFNIYSDGSFLVPGTDAYKAVAFYKVMRNVAIANGGTMLYPPEEDYASGDEALFNDAFNANFLTFHSSGTCRMAQSPVDGVVNSKLHVFGVHKVMVASCAVAPVIEDGNTAYQAFVVGLEAANIILK